MSEPRVIKKYPNRRLYDTAISSYITLEDVRRLVLEGAEFCIQDARSKEDITRSILLQIIMEQEEDGEPIFSTEVLQQIIRFYGDTLQGMITSYLEKSVQLFVNQQSGLRDRMQDAVLGNPITFVRDLTEQNLNLWREMQEGFFRAAVPKSPEPRPEKSKGNKKASGDRS